MEHMYFFLSGEGISEQVKIWLGGPSEQVMIWLGVVSEQIMIWMGRVSEQVKIWLGVACVSRSMMIVHAL